MDYKLILLGDGGVGKSALTARFCRNNFLKQCDPTILDIHSMDLNRCRLEIYDISGADEYRHFRKQYIRDGDGFLLVYSVTSLSSFQLIEPYCQQIRRYNCDAPVVLVGNKCELDQGSARQVCTRDGTDAARRFGCVFFETSALSGINVNESFNKIAEMMQSRYEGDEGGNVYSETSTLCNIKVKKKKIFNICIVQPWYRAWKEFSGTI